MPYIIIGLCVVFIVLLVIRTLRFVPREENYSKIHHVIDETKALKSLSTLIQYQTISYEDKELVDEKAFEDLRSFIFKNYPHLMQHATYTMHEKGILFKLKGQTDNPPVILMSHYDVVPAQEGWSDNPFSGKITETHVYGRGALDTKHSLNAILESVEMMLSKGHRFNRDLYLSFGGDEETYGESQIKIVDHLKNEKISPYFVLDEGGAIVSDIFPGVKKKTAVIGIAEKGFLNIKLVVKSQGGHASTPPNMTPLVVLSHAIKKLNGHPSFRLKLTPPVKALFEQVAPYSSSFFIRLLFANLWLFLPLVKWIAKMSGGEFLSLFKTTQAFTMMEGSDAINVLPSEASVSINYRIIPGETKDQLIKRIKKIIANHSVEIKITDVNEASTISKCDEPFDIIKQSIKETWPDVITAPYLMIATSDSRRYHAISDHVYKFSPMDVTNEDLAKIHGIDEDISKENVINGIAFYLNLLSKI